MSTLRVAAINHPSASSGGLAISSAGNVTGAGLDLITTQSFSAASSVSVNNCFTATYENYRVVLNAAPSTGLQLYWRLRSAGTDDSSNNYNYMLLRGQNGSTSGAVSTANLGIFVGVTSSGLMSVSCDLIAPRIAAPTLGNANSGATGSVVEAWSYNHGLSTAYDGFTLYPSTGTITGSLRIYGYRN